MIREKKLERKRQRRKAATERLQAERQTDNDDEEQKLADGDENWDKSAVMDRLTSAGKTDTTSMDSDNVKRRRRKHRRKRDTDSLEKESEAVDANYDNESDGNVSTESPLQSRLNYMATETPEGHGAGAPLTPHPGIYHGQLVQATPASRMPSKPSQRHSQFDHDITDSQR